MAASGQRRLPETCRRDAKIRRSGDFRQHRLRPGQIRRQQSFHETNAQRPADRLQIRRQNPVLPQHPRRRGRYPDRHSR